MCSVSQKLEVVQLMWLGKKQKNAIVGMTLIQDSQSY